MKKLIEIVDGKPSFNNNKKKKKVIKESYYGIGLSEDNNPADEVTVDVPLLIRLMEYSREDASNDVDLHNVATKMVELSQEGRTLSMDDYEAIVNGQPTDQQPSTEPDENGKQPLFNDEEEMEESSEEDDEEEESLGENLSFMDFYHLAESKSKNKPKPVSKDKNKKRK